MALDPLLEIIKFVAGKVGGKPGAQRWEVVTAIFGWGALFSLVGWFIASLLGYAKAAGWLFAAFGFLFGIAWKRDLIKLWRSMSGQ